jgi:hypothetical protein
VSHTHCVVSTRAPSVKKQCVCGYHTCSFCEKTYKRKEYLDEHLSKKLCSGNTEPLHTENTTTLETVQTSSQVMDTIQPGPSADGTWSDSNMDTDQPGFPHHIQAPTCGNLPANELEIAKMDITGNNIYEVDTYMIIHRLPSTQLVETITFYYNVQPVQNLPAINPAHTINYRFNMPLTCSITGRGQLTPPVIATINIDNLLVKHTNHTALWKGHTPPKGHTKRVEYTPGILEEVSEKLSIFIEQELNHTSLYTSL